MAPGPCASYITAARRSLPVKQSHKTLLLWVLLILMFVAIYNLVAEGEPPRTVVFSDFISDVRAGKVDKVEIRPHDNSAEITFVVQQGDNSAREKKITIGITPKAT